MSHALPRARRNGRIRLDVNKSRNANVLRRIEWGERFVVSVPMEEPERQ